MKPLLGKLRLSKRKFIVLAKQATGEQTQRDKKDSLTEPLVYGKTIINDTKK